MPNDLPVLDLSSFADPEPAGHEHDVAAALDRAFCETGFVLVEGHGISPDATAALFEQARRFFALPAAAKEEIHITRSPLFRGYSGLAGEALDESGPRLGDLKETFDSSLDLGPEHPAVIAGVPLAGPNQWPALPELRAAHGRYLDEAIGAATRVQRAMALALGMPADFFVGLGDPIYHLRLNNYPPQGERSRGRWGCGAHTDYGLVTLLVDDGAPGLQVMHRDGRWLDIEVPAGLVLVNLGDLAAIWTNDRWVSNPHRVLPTTTSERRSIPLFVTPPFFASVECLPTCLAPGEAPRYEPRLAGPYLLGRFDANYSYRNALLEQHLRAELAD